MAFEFDAPVEKKETSSTANGYVSHTFDGKTGLLTVVLDTKVIKPSASGKCYTMFVNFQHNARRVWGNLNISK